MQRLPNSPLPFRFAVRGWAAILVGLSMLAAIALVAVGFFILILPVVLLAPILFRFLPKPKIHRVDIPSEKPPATDERVIEGNFKVIGGGDRQKSDT